MHPRAPYPFEAPSRPPHPFLRALRTPPALAPSVPLVAALSLFGDAAPLRPPPPASPLAHAHWRSSAARCGGPPLAHAWRNAGLKSEDWDFLWLPEVATCGFRSDAPGPFLSLHPGCRGRGWAVGPR